MKERLDRVPIHLGSDGRSYVSVTRAMSLVKTLLSEPEDYYGPLAMVHAAEGSGAHSCTLDWLAFTHGMVPSFVPPKRNPAIHPDETRWTNVMHAALVGFTEFCEAYAVKPVAIEQEATSSALGLIGHIDLLAELTWKKRRVLALIDLKFVHAIQESHRLQLRCYSRLDQMKGCNIGLLYHADRQTGIWRIEQVNLNAGLEDVAAVANAARLYRWAEDKKG
jgi:hypothetical protein